MQHRYFLLVILTTSTGADPEEFRAALTGAAGELALSVIVVGIGSADFGPLKAWPMPSDIAVLHPIQAVLLCDATEESLRLLAGICSMSMHASALLPEVHRFCNILTSERAG